MDTFFQQFKKITKTIAMILSWTMFSILILIIGFIVYYLVSANIYAARGEKFEPKFSLYTIVSPSMEPNIKVYDVILNTKIDPSKIKVGDVITFISTSNISNGMTVTHRVTSIINGEKGLEFKTKGDNNLSEDTDTAKESNVLGKVLLKIPQLGRLQFFLSSKGGWLLVIICPALFIIINDIFKIIKLTKVKKKIDDVNESKDNEEKIELEVFRKNEIKERLNNKELKKLRKLEDKLKDKTLQLPVVYEPAQVPAVIDESTDSNIDEENLQVPVADEPKNSNVEEENLQAPAIIENKEINNKQTGNKKKKRKKKKHNKNTKTNIFGENLEEYNIFSDNYKIKENDKPLQQSNEENKVEIENKTEEKEFSIELPKLK